MSKLKEIIQKLNETFVLDKSWISRAPFHTLIATIISQNTNSQNTARAIARLQARFKITPEALACANPTALEDCLQAAGLQKMKSRRIREVSKIILGKYGGDLSRILEKPSPDARKELMDLPGVGPKTADVVLLFSRREPVLPVDTHIFRVAKRLGFADENAGYEEVRRALEREIEPDSFEDAHLLLIMLGRRFCRAQNPLCEKCPIQAICFET